MKNILVVYYSQSGQLGKIARSITTPLEEDNNVNVYYAELKPDPPYPFPWGKEFFDCFPESVKGIPCKLNSLSDIEEKNYDLFILCYQPWYMSPSIPFFSFLQTEKAASLLKNKNVITVIGARNMWIGAQEIVKKRLKDIGANLVGNIVLVDRTENHIAGFTIIRWLIHGKKEAGFLLPEAGVSGKDITEAAKFGEIINQTLSDNKWNSLQEKLLKAKAVNIKFHLLMIERNGRKIFDKFAAYALKKGNVGEAKRKPRIRLFKIYLLFALFVVSPIVTIVFVIIRILFFPFANKKILYYRGVDL
ncbi:MAG: hypothetical protein JXB49_28630 [Bacteroidales bacterium]|nr:hypothetical protein [Bacteroidales bacterium]